MRITNSMMSQQLLYNLNQIQTSLSDSQNEIATGKVLNKPSDNPLATTQDMAFSTAISQSQSYLTNIQTGQTWMKSTMGVLSSMTSAVQSIRDIVLQAMNSPGHTSTAIVGLQQEVGQVTNSIYQLADTKQGNSYLFGGYATDQQVSQYITSSQLTTNATAATTTTPVVANGGTLSVLGGLGTAQVTIPTNATLQDIETSINNVQSQTGVTANLATGGAGYQLTLTPQNVGTAYGMSANGVTLSGGSTLAVTSSQQKTQPAGSTGTIRYAISASTTEKINVTATQIFNQVPPDGTQGLQDTLQSILNDINDPNALQQDLSNLDANSKQLIQFNTEVGARANHMQTMATQTNQFITNMQNQQASLEDANMAQVLTNYQNQMATYQAALQMGSKMLLPTLAQYLQ